MRKMIFMSMAFVGLCACSKDVETAKVPETSADVIPVEEAMANLQGIMENLYGATKAGREIGESSVSVVKGGDIVYGTKAESLNLPDTLLYLVNFEGENGFAVLSANRCLSESTYCVTENGSISIEDFRDAISEMEGNTQFSEDELGFVPSLLASAIILDALDVPCEEDDPDDVEEISTKADEKYGPYLKTKWGQTKIGSRRVFNRYTPNHAACGCVVIATAQIMAYQKQPAGAEGYAFDGKYCYWDHLEGTLRYDEKSTQRDTIGWDEVAHFVRELGKHDNCKMRYGDSEGDASGGYAEGAQRTFQNYGFVDVDKHLGFGKKKRKIADKVLRNGNPVYLDGSGKNSGHAWVLDGLNGDYYHINWGWYGMSDGYYSKGVFKTSQRSSVDGIDSGSTSSYSHYYKNFRMVTYSIKK